MHILEKIGVLRFVATAAVFCTATAFSGTGSAIGATDALNAFFLSPMQVQDYSAQNQDDNSDDDVINSIHKHYLPLSAYSALTFLSAWAHR